MRLPPASVSPSRASGCPSASLRWPLHSSHGGGAGVGWGWDACCSFKAFVAPLPSWPHLDLPFGLGRVPGCPWSLSDEHGLPHGRSGSQLVLLWGQDRGPKSVISGHEMRPVWLVVRSGRPPLREGGWLSTQRAASRGGPLPQELLIGRVETRATSRMDRQGQ